MLSHSLKLQQQASRSACAACRLRQDIAVKQLARSRWSGGLQILARNANASTSTWNHGGSKRGFAASPALGVRTRRAGGRGVGAREEKAGEGGEQASRSRQEQEHEQDVEAEAEEEPREISPEQARLSRLLYASSLKANMSTQRLIELVNVLRQDLSAEQRALEVRKAFGDTLPEGLLGEEDEAVYLRLYGEPVVRLWERDLESLEEEVLAEEMEEEAEEEGTNLARKGPEGEFEDVEFVDEEGEEVGEGEEGEGEVLEGDDARLRADIRNALDAEEALEEAEEEADEEDEFGPMMRAHPLTVAGRFATSPSSIQLPRDTFVEPVQLLLSRTAPVHLKDAAHKVFGGIGLPYSASTPSLAKTMQQKPIPLDATQYRMSDIDANSFLSVLMPAMYSSVMATLVETRKRLGTAWAEQLVRQAEAGELKILDAGGAGAGVLAVRNMLKAEWQRMREEDPEAAASTAIAEADGKVGGAALSPPLGNATVLTASDALRQRSAALLDNTTFIPRLPDYVHAETESARKTGKFDLVLAPHTLFPIREDWARRNHVDNLWSLVSSEGGVLVMLEKGIARGFEAIALAREHVLKTHIATPGPEEERTQNIDEEEVVWDEPSKETGMIIAPCTNHTECPMYSGKNKGVIKGRKDICHFQQRYTRPTFLQKILGARDKNFEDVKFSYVALMRGRDLRVPMPERADDSAFANAPTAVQGDEATDSAFAGYENVEEAADSASPETATTAPSPFSLPRQILHPLKRRGHVILDMCTPAGSLERWTVPRSFSKRAFRDARKASWGDLWALGAKTRVVKTARVGDKKRLKAEEKAQGEGEEGGRPERKKLTKRVAKEKRRVKERKAGKKGVILGRVREGDEELD